MNIFSEANYHIPWPVAPKYSNDNNWSRGLTNSFMSSESDWSFPDMFGFLFFLGGGGPSGSPLYLRCQLTF